MVVPWKVSYDKHREHMKKEKNKHEVEFADSEAERDYSF